MHVSMSQTSRCGCNSGGASPDPLSLGTRDVSGLVTFATRILARRPANCPAGGKVARAASVQAIVESGAVVLPAHASWVDAWLDEVTRFPQVKHDDQVDPMVYALRELQGADTDEERATLRNTYAMLGLSKAAIESKVNETIARKHGGPSTKPKAEPTIREEIMARRRQKMPWLPKTEPTPTPAPEPEQVDEETHRQRYEELVKLCRAIGKEPPPFMPMPNAELEQRNMIEMHDEYQRRSQNRAGGPVGAMDMLSEAFASLHSPARWGTPYRGW